MSMVITLGVPVTGVDNVSWRQLNPIALTEIILLVFQLLYSLLGHISTVSFTSLANFMFF